MGFVGPKNGGHSAPAPMITKDRTSNLATFDPFIVGDHHAVPNAYLHSTSVVEPLLTVEPGASRQAAHHPALHQCRPVRSAVRIGTDQQTFEAMGAEYRFRPSAFEESLTMVCSLRTGMAVRGSKVFQNRQARINPLPPTPILIRTRAGAQLQLTGQRG